MLVPPVKHSSEEHKTKMGYCDSGADMVIELEAGQQKFLNKFPKILNNFLKLCIQLQC